MGEVEKMREEENIPKAVESKKLQFLTSIWLVPIIAILISIWLIYQYFSQLGPEVVILFEESGGLKANQSTIKYRDVTVGVVKKITLQEGVKGVVVKARMNVETAPYLNENTKFWIVKPVVSTNGITGLETLVSGSYIELDSARGEKEERFFIGLEEPFVDPSSNAGKRYHLVAPEARNLQKGSPIYYRKVKVGKIEKLNISKDGSHVEFVAFVKSPYHELIKSHTKFWAMSGMDIDFSNSSLSLDFAPFAYILNSGIEFGTNPIYFDQNSSIEDSDNFFLFKSLADAKERKFYTQIENLKRYKISFDSPVANLGIGATVAFRGIKIGEVLEVKFNYDCNSTKIVSEIFIGIDHTIFEDNNRSGEENLKNAVKNRGLRAHVDSTNPIIGSLFINLYFDKNVSQEEIVSLGDFDIFPSSKSKRSDLMKDVNHLVKSLDTLVLSLDDTINDSSKPLVDILKNIRKLISKKDTQNIPIGINKSLKDLQKILKSTQYLLDADGANSLLAEQITIMLKELTATSKSMNSVLEKLEKKPNSLIFGDD
jgi:paraquat-inducible protein B